MPKSDTNKAHAIIMWIIWFSVLQGAFLIQWFLGKGIPQGENAPEPMALSLWALCFGPVVLASLVRWLVIPKLKDAQQQLTAMIIGLALAEAPIFFSLFLVGPNYPQNQIAILMIAVVAIIQFAPSYATPGYDKSRKLQS